MKPAGLFTFLFFLLATLAMPIVAEAIDRRSPFEDANSVVARSPKKKSGGSGSSSSDESGSGSSSFALPTGVVNLGAVGLAGVFAIAALA